MAKRVVMISYHFPPDRGAASLRSAKFAHYLPQFEWTPTVFAPSDFYTAAGTDPAEENEPTTEIIRVSNKDWARIWERHFGKVPMGWVHPQSRLELGGRNGFRSRLFRVAHWCADNFLFIPDRANLWISPCLRTVRRWLKGHSADVIYSASPYSSNHLAALRLHHATGLPWVADFHDPWTPVTAPQLTPLRRKVDEYLERRVITCATRVVFNTPQLQELYARKHPYLRGKCVVITSGYDPEDFRGLHRERSDDTFRIVYCGSFYHGIRNPEPLLASVARLLKTSELNRDKLELRISGGRDEFLERLVMNFGLSPITKLLGSLCHREALQEMVNADLLWLVAGDYPCAEVFQPLKLCEYLAVGAPILSFSPPGGAAAALIQQRRAGIVISNNQRPEDVDRAIVSLYQTHLQKRTYSVRRSLPEFEWKALAGELAHMLGEVTAEGS